MTDDLEALALHVEHGGDAQAVTLVIAGTILSGIVISRETYLDEARDLARAASKASLLSEIGEPPRSSAAEPSAYLHLRAVTIILGHGRVEIEIASTGGPPGRSTGLARVRLGDVHAWLPGLARITASPHLTPEEQEGDEDVGAKIVHIAPAEPGWRAVYDLDGRTSTRPIACWALVHERYDDEDGKGVVTYVAPIVPEIAANHDNGTIVGSFFGNFAGVAGPMEDPEEVRTSNARIAAMDAEEGEHFRRQDRARAGKLLYLYATKTTPGQA